MEQMQIEEAAKKYHWFRIAEDGIPELYLDHSMLSAFRACEAYFVETYLKNLRGGERNWNLDFGSWLHLCLEKFYWHEKNKFEIVKNQAFYDTVIKHDIPFDPADYTYISKGAFLAHGLMLWDKMKMDYFDGRHKMYKTMQGNLGAAKLLSDYYEVYGGGQERLRVVGMELGFGLKKEAPIVDWDSKKVEVGNTRPYTIRKEDEATYKYNLLYSPIWLDSKVVNGQFSGGRFRAYLTGRIDLLVDDLVSIAVFDHKSTAFFNGSESTKFTPHDGMRGYVYAADRMLQSISSDKRCTKMIVNHICLGEGLSKETNPKGDNFKPVKVMDATKRFTRTAVSYSPESLQEFVKLQQVTFANIFSLVIDERPAQWNTSACGNMYHKDCPFKSIHAMTPSIREEIMKQQFVEIEQWNPFDSRS